jgi:hypothetical protein
VTRVEFSKKMLLFSWLVTIILTFLSISLCVAGKPTDMLYVITPMAWAETATSTGYYYWKSKNENRAKYAQKFINNLAKEWGTETALRVAEIVLKD